MKKKIQLIDKRVLVEGDEKELLKNEILVENTSSHKFKLKELIDGELKTVSDGEYETKTVKATGVTQLVTPSSGKSALSSVTVTPSDKLIVTLDTANEFYKIVGGESGGTVTINSITGGSNILICQEPSTGYSSVTLKAITEGSVSIVCNANESLYVAFYSSTQPTGTQGGTAVKSDSTESEFKTKIDAFLIA